MSIKKEKVRIYANMKFGSFKAFERTISLGTLVAVNKREDIRVVVGSKSGDFVCQKVGQDKSNRVRVPIGKIKAIKMSPGKWASVSVGK